MGKKINNSLTRKDGNKLGKRKQKMYSGKHLDSLGVYAMRKLARIDENSLNPFYSHITPRSHTMYTNPNMEKGVHIKRVAIDELDDELNVMADWIPNEVSMDIRLMLPSFSGPISEILSMDHGIKAGDMACISVVQHTDDMFRSNIMQTTMMYARENGVHVATTCLEVDHEETINRVIDIIKNQEPPTVFKPYIHQDENEFYKQIEKYKNMDRLEDDDHHTVWCGPMMDYDRKLTHFSNNNYEVNNEIFLRARNVGKSIIYPNILFPVKVEK